MDKYYKWYEQEYLKSTGIARLQEYAQEEKAEIQARIAAAMKNFQFRVSSIWRHEILSIMRFYVPLRKTGYICSVFRISRPDPAKKIDYQAAYAFLYSHYDEKSKKIVHDYLCTTGTFRSADGEYRHRFITIRQLGFMYKKFQSYFDFAEKTLLPEMKKGRIHCYTEFIFPEELQGQEERMRKQMEQEINSNSWPLIFWAISWLIYSEYFLIGSLENHLTKGFREAVIGDDTETYQKWRQGVKTEEFTLFVIGFSRFFKHAEQMMNFLEIGQKFIPLTIREVEEADNIQHRPWREMYITSLVGNLVINGISPSFPIFGDWFFIRGVRKSMYDNQINHLRMTHSAAAEEIVKQLEVARRGTYIVDPVEKKEVYLSYNLEGLSQAIEIPVDYAEQDLVFSEYTLCSLNEHIGRTLGDLPRLITDFAYRHPFGPILQNYRTFAFYLYEYVHALYALNKHLDVVHGDPHLNNVTFFMKVAPNEMELAQKPHIIFQAGDECYIFPFYGRHVALIDFSRGILGPARLTEFPEEEREAIVQQQHKRMLDVMQKEFPEFCKNHEDKIRLALYTNFEAVFRIFTVTDMHKIAMGWLYILDLLRKEKEKHKEYLDAHVLQHQIIPLVEKIRAHAINIFTTQMLRVFQRQVQKAGEVEYPNLQLIQRCFEEFNLRHFTEEFTLADFFSAENTQRFDINQYEKFPETVKFDYIIKHKLPIEEVGLKNYEEHKKYLAKHPPEEQIAAISEEVLAQRAERRGLPDGLHAEHEADKKDIAQYRDEAQTLSSEYYFET